MEAVRRINSQFSAALHKGCDEGGKVIGVARHWQLCLIIFELDFYADLKEALWSVSQVPEEKKRQNFRGGQGAAD